MDELSQQGRLAPGPRPSPLGTVADTLEFVLRNSWRGFFERRRQRYNSDIFRVNLFQPTVALLDGEAIAALFASPDLCQDYGFSWARPPLPLVGEEPPTIFLNGEAHDCWKALWLDVLRDASADLPASFDKIADEYFAHWHSRRAFPWRDELESFAAALLFHWLLGFRPDPADVRLIYNHIFGHLAPSLARRFPRSRYARSLRAYPRLVTAIHQSPKFERIASLAARHGLNDQKVLAKQLSFLLGMNAYLGTQNLLKSIVGELGSRIDLRQQLQEELTQASTNGQLATEEIHRLALLDATIKEVLRLHSPVTFVFGRATKDRHIASRAGPFRIAAGELLMGVIPFVHNDPQRFPNPERFDITRYQQEGAARNLIWPRGPHDEQVEAHDRCCPGKDVAVLIAKLMAVRLLGWDWEFEEPVRWGERRFSLNVAAPAGTLSVINFRPRVSP